MIEPTQDRVLIQRDESIKTTESGFIIPDEAQRKETSGIVIATGIRVKENITKGTRVIFGLNDGVPIDSQYCDGLNRCILLKEDTIRGIINND